MTIPMRRAELKAALNYVHFWESPQRGPKQLSRAEAARQAVDEYKLTEHERAALYESLGLPT